MMPQMIINFNRKAINDRRLFPYAETANNTVIITIICEEIVQNMLPQMKINIAQQLNNILFVSNQIFLSLNSLFSFWKRVLLFNSHDRTEYKPILQQENLMVYLSYQYQNVLEIFINISWSYTKYILIIFTRTEIITCVCQILAYILQSKLLYTYLVVANICHENIAFVEPETPLLVTKFIFISMLYPFQIGPPHFLSVHT